MVSPYHLPMSLMLSIAFWKLVTRLGEAQILLPAALVVTQPMASPTPIQPILVGDSARALQLSALLKERGLLVGAIRPPTVPAGSARLRVTLSAAHSEAQLERLLAALAECWPLVNQDA